jgi:hypothetical protein
MDKFIQGYEAATNEINTQLNGAVAHMDEAKSAQGTLQAFNMMTARVHIMKQNVKELHANQGGM